MGSAGRVRLTSCEDMVTVTEVKHHIMHEDRRQFLLHRVRQRLRAKLHEKRLRKYMQHCCDNPDSEQDFNSECLLANGRQHKGCDIEALRVHRETHACDEAPVKLSIRSWIVRYDDEKRRSTLINCALDRGYVQLAGFADTNDAPFVGRDPVDPAHYRLVFMLPEGFADWRAFERMIYEGGIVPRDQKQD